MIPSALKYMWDYPFTAVWFKERLVVIVAKFTKDSGERVLEVSTIRMK